MRQNFGRGSKNTWTGTNRVWWLSQAYSADAATEMVEIPACKRAKNPSHSWAGKIRHHRGRPILQAHHAKNQSGKREQLIVLMLVINLRRFGSQDWRRHAVRWWYGVCLIGVDWMLKEVLAWRGWNGRCLWRYRIRWCGCYWWSSFTRHDRYPSSPPYMMECFNQARRFGLLLHFPYLNNHVTLTD